MGLPVNFHSIRSIVTSIIVVLGLLSLAATLVTGQVYHRLTLESQLENIQKQLANETDQVLARLKQFSLQFSTIITSSDTFNSGPGAGILKPEELRNSPYLRNGVLDLNYIYVFNDTNDLKKGLVVNGERISQTSEIICEETVSMKQASNRISGDDIFYDICTRDNRPFLISKLSYKTGKKKGTLVLLSNITANLAHIEDVVSFPVRITLLGNGVIYSSSDWPEKVDLNSLARHVVFNSNDESVIYIDSVHYDVNLDEALENAQLIVVSGAALVIFIIVVLSIMILKVSVISPVREVMSSLRMVRDNKENIGAQVNSRGADEVVQLMDDFNAMSKTLEQLYSALEKMAYTDSLTRLGNRKLFHEKLQQIFFYSRENRYSFALFIIDLNKFKHVNDTYGHQVGDGLLVEISNRFSEVIRQEFEKRHIQLSPIATGVQDHLARLGGDEFAIILPEIKSEQEAIDLAESLSAILDDAIVIEGITVDVGLSTGIAIYPRDANTEEGLIMCADQAMYQCKQNRERYRLCSS